MLVHPNGAPRLSSVSRTPGTPDKRPLDVLVATGHHSVHPLRPILSFLFATYAPITSYSHWLSMSHNPVGGNYLPNLHLHGATLCATRTAST